MRLNYWRHSGYEAQGEVVEPVVYTVENDDGSIALVVWDPTLNRWQEVAAMVDPT